MKRLLLTFSTLLACEGAEGIQGPPGAAGTKGDQGNAGPMGGPGGMGVPGDMGDKGDLGDQGPVGPTVVLSSRASQGFAVSPVPIDTSSLAPDQFELVGRGSYIVNAIGACNDCHQYFPPAGPPEYLGGGQPFDLGLGGGERVYARNLTPDPASGLDLTEEEFMHVMREGEDHDAPGEALLVMPWFGYRWMTDEDILSIYAYLQVIPPIANPVPADIKGAAAAFAPIPFSGRYDEIPTPRDLPDTMFPDPNNVLRGLAIQPVNQDADIDNLGPDDLSRFGRGSYLVNAIANCNDCHTNPFRVFAPGPQFLRINVPQYLSGGGVFEAPPPLDMITGYKRAMTANLTGASFGYQENFETFLRSMSAGIHRSGTRPLAFPMPWQTYGNMEIDDLQAIYVYVRNVPARAGANDKEIQPPARFCVMNSDCDTVNGETCATTTSECVGGPCFVAVDCGACQTCGASFVCEAPDNASPCLTMGI